ncbi:hypothetical protein GCM10009801_37300 [Streptomyces albiaxialis]|uniref:Secreted protein n=1 Tax=Streptomyces albiaxialis TaxID=329523 RepID=A0ABP5HNN2_9ACTN
MARASWAICLIPVPAYPWRCISREAARTTRARVPGSTSAFAVFAVFVTGRSLSDRAFVLEPCYVVPTLWIERSF